MIINQHTAVYQKKPRNVCCGPFFPVPTKKNWIVMAVICVVSSPDYWQLLSMYIRKIILKTTTMHWWLDFWPLMQSKSGLLVNHLDLLGKSWPQVLTNNKTPCENSRGLKLSRPVAQKYVLASWWFWVICLARLERRLPNTPLRKTQREDLTTNSSRRGGIHSRQKSRV